jgi:hypothetical protein
LLHKRAPCVHTRIRCPSSMSIEQWACLQEWDKIQGIYFKKI